jgi:hypothetical protein
MNVFILILTTLGRQKRIRKWEDGNMGRKFSILPILSPVVCLSASSDFYSRIEGLGVFKD